MANHKGTKEDPWVLKRPLMEELGLVELEHNAKNNRIRAT
jgi:hypothetical protein